MDRQQPEKLNLCLAWGFLMSRPASSKLALYAAQNMTLVLALFQSVCLCSRAIVVAGGCKVAKLCIQNKMTTGQQ